MKQQSKKPVIGILANVLTIDKGPLTGSERVYVNRDYVQAILKVGGIPMLMPIVQEQEMIRRQIDSVDALLLSGGQDVVPHHYGEDPSPCLQETCPERDLYELEAVRYAFSLGYPILGICRGLQLLNVAFGGSLYQDIPHSFPGCLEHMQKEKKEEATHPVTMIKGSKLYPIFDSETVPTNSFHHQSIKKLAPGFRVNAHAADEIIEGIERQDVPFVMGVQWHPEMMVDKHPAMLKLFHHFVWQHEHR